jgi:flagellar L-ring protein precursor FlgH
MNKTAKYISILAVATSLTACANTIERLEKVGKAPPVREIQNPIEQANYQPVSWPTPVEPGDYVKNSGSLWAKGSRSFFKDQRASRVGDILTIVVDINDDADLTNKTSQSRTNTENLAAPNVFGLEETALKLLPGNPILSSLLNINGNNTTEGDGQIGRGEQINLKIAAMITQVLPNGNMVVQGTQDLRVNYEVRQVFISGVIRPEDISSENTIQSEQIAEARVSYGGEGTLSDIQQPRYGTQVIDILSPF